MNNNLRFSSQAIDPISRLSFYICRYMSKGLTQTIITIALAWAITGLSSCANMLPPGGGPRDSLPPRLVMATPKDSGLNASGHEVNLVFDEYVTLDNPITNVIISPNAEKHAADHVQAPECNGQFPEGYPAAEYHLYVRFWRRGERCE
jgi:hypothetical protein